MGNVYFIFISFKDSKLKGLLPLCYYTRFFFKIVLIKDFILIKKVKLLALRFFYVFYYHFASYYCIFDLQQNTYYFFKSNKLQSNFLQSNLKKSFYKLYKFNKHSIQKFYYYKIILQGLGYKIFFNGDLIYILLGLSHYVLIDVPDNIYIKCRKKKYFY